MKFWQIKQGLLQRWMRRTMFNILIDEVIEACEVITAVNVIYDDDLIIWSTSS